MEKLSKGSRRQYLSAPDLNKMNNEVYLEGNRFFSDNHSESFFSPSKTFKGERSKSFMSAFSLIGSSANERGLSSPSKLLGFDILPKSSRSWYSDEQNVRKASTHSDKSSRDESPRINGNTSPMTQAQSLSRGPADPDGSAGAPLTTKNVEASELIHTTCSSKARQKKFHRHFKQVDVDEKVLNYYSCALVGDILLQGHLYITENFFAFYSNVFGYVTKLLIPTVDVLKISKEKTAKIIPNAVGISTEDEKHVFGSLLSRDSTYKFMLQVWKAANNSNLVPKLTSPPIIKTELPSDEDSSVSSGNEDASSYISSLTTPASSDNLQKLIPTLKRKSILMTSMEVQNSKRYWNSFKVKTLLAICVTLLVCLFGSTGYLLYKIAIIQNHFNDLPRGSNTFEEIVKWQSMQHSSSNNKLNEFLNNNLNQIIKIRLSLEALSMLILPPNYNDNNYEKSNQNSKWESTNDKKSDETTDE